MRVWPGFAPLLLACLLMGCATLRQACDYYPDGRLEHYEVSAGILGRGETELITTDCTALAYSTAGTGLSDNGKAALGEIAKGAASGLLPIP